MNDVQIERYADEMAADVAALVENSFSELRQEPPIRFLNPPEQWETRDELLETLTSERLCATASHVAVEDGRPVSAALAVECGEGCAWWRIGTAPTHRRRGLARACVEAGESALREAGQQTVLTEAIVDSRWEGAAAFIEALGYALEDPERRNITMVADEWTPRPVELPDGYALGTLADTGLGEWLSVRNEVFGSEHTEEWFRARFIDRPDWDPEGWFVVRHEGRIAGIASGICVEQERDPERLRGGQIEWVGVLGEHRGLHLGEELMVACLNHIAERDFLPVLLITQPFRVPAVTLYEKLGFRTTAAWHRWTKKLG